PSSSSRLVAKARRRLSGLQLAPLSAALLDVRRRGAALPSPGTIQRSDTSFFSSLEGSVTEQATHLPSAETTRARTRFIFERASCVMCFSAASYVRARSLL